MLYFAIQELLAHHTHLSPCYKDYIHVDMKVMPMNNSGTKKEGVNLTYNKVSIGQEGYWLELDFRPGKQHSRGEETMAFLVQTLESLRSLLYSRFLLRADSAYESVGNY